MKRMNTVYGAEDSSPVTVSDYIKDLDEDYDFICSALERAERQLGLKEVLDIINKLTDDFDAIIERLADLISE